ncbi:MAG: hypothetical protein IPH78_15220 [Bacteroidetes bacterium]|nr:hypothetical protein [Bacteroidota bacterium]
MFSSAFEQEEKNFTNQKRIKSLLATISFAALLLAFYLVKLTIPNTPFPELSAGGVEINFGFDETGTGDEQAFSENPGPISETLASGATSASSENEETLTQEDEETEVIVEKPTDKPKVKPTSTTTTTAKTNRTRLVNTNNNKTNTTSEPVQKAGPDALFPTKGAKGTPNKKHGDGYRWGQR